MLRVATARNQAAKRNIVNASKLELNALNFANAKIAKIVTQTLPLNALNPLDSLLDLTLNLNTLILKSHTVVQRE